MSSNTTDSLDNNDFFATLQGGMTTHLDIRKHGMEITEQVVKDGNKWIEIISEYMQTIPQCLKERDIAKTKQLLGDLTKKCLKTRDENVDNMSRMLGLKLADAYSVGYVEGRHEAIKSITKMIQSKIDEDSIIDINGNLTALLKILNTVDQQQYDETFAGKNLTFFSPNSTKNN